MLIRYQYQVVTDKSLPAVAQKKIIYSLLGIVVVFGCLTLVSKTTGNFFILWIHGNYRDAIMNTVNVHRQGMYINNNFGVSFEIPRDLVRVKSGNPFVVLPASAVDPDNKKNDSASFSSAPFSSSAQTDSECIINFGIEQNEHQLPLAQWLQEKYFYDPGMLEEFKGGNIPGIRQTRSLKYTNILYPSATKSYSGTYFSHKNNIFSFGIFGNPDAVTEKCEQDFEQILSSFRIRNEENSL